MNIYLGIAIIGLISIIAGTFLISAKRKIRRRYTYPLLILGGICLEIYSISIGNVIFIILQGFFILSSVWGLIRINERALKNLLEEIK
jgi:lipid-A-disaccharide synthase-like uncharacterized protein